MWYCWSQFSARWFGLRQTRETRANMTTRKGELGSAGYGLSVGKVRHAMVQLKLHVLWLWSTLIQTCGALGLRHWVTGLSLMLLSAGVFIPLEVWGMASRRRNGCVWNLKKGINICRSSPCEYETEQSGAENHQLLAQCGLWLLHSSVKIVLKEIKETWVLFFFVIYYTLYTEIFN